MDFNKKQKQSDDEKLNQTEGKTEEKEQQSHKQKGQMTDSVEEKHDETKEKIAEYESKWKRAVADYRNLEARMHEQRAEWLRSANRDLLIHLLPVLDTLLLATQHSQDKTLSVSVSQFLDILKAEGVTKIEAVGKEFDPLVMEAIMTAEGEENKVLEELRAGFLLYDKVLRPVQVKVGSCQTGTK